MSGLFVQIGAIEGAHLFPLELELERREDRRKGRGGGHGDRERDPRGPHGAHTVICGVRLAEAEEGSCLDIRRIDDEPRPVGEALEGGIAIQMLAVRTDDLVGDRAGKQSCRPGWRPRRSSYRRGDERERRRHFESHARRRRFRRRGSTSEARPRPPQSSRLRRSTPGPACPRAPSRSAARVPRGERASHGIRPRTGRARARPGGRLVLLVADGADGRVRSIVSRLLRRHAYSENGQGVLSPVRRSAAARLRSSAPSPATPRGLTSQAVRLVGTVGSTRKRALHPVAQDAPESSQSRLMDPVSCDHAGHRHLIHLHQPAASSQRDSRRSRPRFPWLP